jgi:hypothetical protein
MIFKKGGRNRTNLTFKYDGTDVEIGHRFSYLDIVFLQDGLFSNI